jgi:hypothetical protein
LDAPGSTNTYPYGINNSGQIAGQYNASRLHGFLLDQGNYTTLDVPGSTQNNAAGINDAGLIVGTYFDSRGIHHGYLATPQARPPKITSLSLDRPSIFENQSVTLSGAFTPAATQPHHVSIDWGDGTTTPLDLDPAAVAFSTTHQYTEDSAFLTLPINVTLTAQDGGTDTASTSVVVFEAPISVAPRQPTVLAVEGAATGSVPVAVFQDSGGGEPASQYAALINWGDGTPEEAFPAIQVGGDGTITVSGNHTYARAGTYSPRVTLLDDGLVAAVAANAVDVVIDVSSQVQVQRSGLYYNRRDQLFYGTLTVTNTGTSDLAGSLQVLLGGLTPGVTLTSASITVGSATYSLPVTPTGSGDPIIDVPKGLVSSLAPDELLQISVRFSDPLFSLIGYTPEVFSDPFDTRVIYY